MLERSHTIGSCGIPDSESSTIADATSPISEDQDPPDLPHVVSVDVCVQSRLDRTQTGTRQGSRDCCQGAPRREASDALENQYAPRTVLQESVARLIHQGSLDWQEALKALQEQRKCHANHRTCRGFLEFPTEALREREPSSVLGTELCVSCTQELQE